MLHRVGRQLVHGQRERLRQADSFDERARHFLDQKIEGIVEAPLGIVVCCDHGDPDAEILGRATIPETDVYSTACAIQNLWLAARAEGIGLGWVSILDPARIARIAGVPEGWRFVGYLCLGYPESEADMPELAREGWEAPRRTPILRR